MTMKLKKGATINTKDKLYTEAFEKMKVLITSDPILIYLWQTILFNNGRK